MESVRQGERFILCTEEWLSPRLKTSTLTFNDPAQFSTKTEQGRGTYS